jgi:hypothetical protein
MRRAVLLLCLLLPALAGCGGSDKASTPTATATATATEQAAAGGGLSEDELLAVHDEVYECLRKAQLGVLASYQDGEASVAESVQQPVYDSRLAAPRTESRLLDAGDASFIGIRANRRVKPGRRAPDWDLLVFPSEEAALAALPDLEAEARSVTPQSVYVRVARRAAANPRAETILEGCLPSVTTG